MTHRPESARCLAVAFAVATLSACAPNRGVAYERALAEARIASHNGHFDAAARRFDEASKNAKIPRDRTYARYEAALAWARAGDVARGAAELRAIATTKPPTAYSAQAAFKAAELARSGGEKAFLHELEDVVVEFPNSGVAHVALAHLLRHDDEEGAETALTHLERLAPRVKDASIEEKVVYERARRLDALGRKEEARDAFLEAARRWPYPFGSFNDDALFRAAELENKLGRPNEAIARLEQLLAQREVSSFVGSYERPRYVPALLRIVEISEGAGDRTKARETLHRLYKDFTTSTMRDDALWREATLWRKDGNAETACHRLATLASEFPDSRYVPCIAVYCPAIQRRPSSKAPTTCRDYLRRAETETPE